MSGVNIQRGGGGGGSGSVATDAIWDAKGDLAAGTGANTAAKVTVGADGTVLVADSTVSTGVSWQQRAAPGINGGRLTLQSGVAVPVTDQTAKTTIYWTPHITGQIALPSAATGPWTLVVPGEISVAVPSTLFKLFDVFGYLSGGTLALETVDWTQISATINAFDGTSEFTTSAAHGMAVGDLVGITSIVGTSGTDATLGVNGRVWRVATTSTTSKFTLSGSGISGKTYTSGGTIYRIPTARATALTTLNGVLAKNGDATRIYLGTGMTTGGGTGTSSPTSGQIDDSGAPSADAAPANRYLWNFFNRTIRTGVVQTSGTYTYNSNTTRYVNGLPSNQVAIILGLADQELQTVGSGGQLSFSTAGGTTNFGRLSCGTAGFALSGAISESANTDLIRGSASLPRMATVGLNWFPAIEGTAGVGTMTVTAGRAMVFYMG